MALTPDGRPYYLDETRRETSWHRELGAAQRPG